MAAAMTSPYPALKNQPPQFRMHLREATGIASAWKGILLDWDGCLAISNRLHPEAIDFLKQHQDRIAIVSNNSTDLPADFFHILARHQIHIPENRILLAGAQAVLMAARLNEKRAIILANRKMTQFARQAGLEITREDAGIVVLLRDTQLSYPRLERAANALHAGARLIVANSDRTHPGKDQSIVPETGAILAALLECVRPHDPDLHIIGKPSPSLYEAACNVLGVPFGESVMIGDNPDTDIAGARALGMAAILVPPIA